MRFVDDTGHELTSEVRYDADLGGVEASSTDDKPTR